MATLMRMILCEEEQASNDLCSEPRGTPDAPAKWNTDFYACAIAGVTFEIKAAAYFLHSLFHVAQTVSQSVRLLFKPLAIVFDLKRKVPILGFGPYPDFGCCRMLDHVIEGFFDHQK